MIELVGEPGIGKSRLVAAVREEADGMNVLSIQGGPYAARTPYLAMRRGLRAAVLPGLPDDADLAGRWPSASASSTRGSSPGCR